MGFFRKRRGSTQGKGPFSAREALTAAEGAINEKHPEDAQVARVCCLYTASLDSEAPIQSDGRCKAWHVDFYSPASRSLFLVRIHKGKTHVRARSWDRTGSRPVAYFFMGYGEGVTGNVLVEPIPVGEGWVDSLTLAREVDTWSRSRMSEDERTGEMYGLSCLGFPAQYLAYLHRPDLRALFPFPDPPSEPAWFVFYSPVDLEDRDSFLLYLDAATGRITHSAVFRFPAYFNYGSSADW